MSGAIGDFVLFDYIDGGISVSIEKDWMYHSMWDGTTGKKI